jgi:hypothetical protein
VITSGGLREIEAEVVGEEDGVGAAEKKGGRPVPPASEEAPEVAESGAHPAIEAALHGHGGGEFCGDERDRDAPEKWNQQMKEQRHAGAGVADLLFEAEGATGGVGEHDEDEVEKGGFADDGRGWVWVGCHGGLRASSVPWHGEHPSPLFNKC